MPRPARTWTTEWDQTRFLFLPTCPLVDRHRFPIHQHGESAIQPSSWEFLQIQEWEAFGPSNLSQTIRKFHEINTREIPAENFKVRRERGLSASLTLQLRPNHRGRNTGFLRQSFNINQPLPARLCRTQNLSSLASNDTGPQQHATLLAPSQADPELCSKSKESIMVGATACTTPQGIC